MRTVSRAGKSVPILQGVGNLGRAPTRNFRFGSNYFCPLQTVNDASRKVDIVFKSIDCMGVRFFSFITAALVASSSMAQAQPSLSDSDRFALYCMGALQAATETLLHLYPNVCPTGAERGCASVRETIETIEEGRTLTRQYLAARRIEQRGITGRLLVTVRNGESEQKRCLRWRIETLGSTPAGGPPPYCRQTELCRDLSRLSLERPASLALDPH